MEVAKGVILNGFDRWMVERNLERVPKVGLSEVVAELLAGGYEKVANEVKRRALVPEYHGPVRKESKNFFHGA